MVQRQLGAVALALGAIENGDSVQRSAVADLGKDQVVFVKDRGVFKPRRVKTGLRTDGWYEIRNGLASAEDIAEEAAFLVDSESFIKVAYE